MVPKMLSILALVSTLLAAIVTGAAAQSAVEVPNEAYFVVHLHYCPLSRDPDTSMPVGDAAVVYEVLMGTYGGNCEAFYLNEVLPRIYLQEGT